MVVHLAFYLMSPSDYHHVGPNIMSTRVLAYDALLCFVGQCSLVIRGCINSLDLVHPPPSDTCHMSIYPLRTLLGNPPSSLPFTLTCPFALPLTNHKSCFSTPSITTVDVDHSTMAYHWYYIIYSHS